MLKVQCIHINKKLHANAAQLTSKGQHSCTSALQPLLLLLQLYQHSANVQTNRINAATNKEGFTEYSSCLNTINREHCWDHSYLTSTCVTFSPVPYVCNEGGCKDNFSLQLMFDLWPVAQLNNHLITRLPPGSSMLLAQGKHMTPHPWHKLSCNANAWSCSSSSQNFSIKGRAVHELQHLPCRNYFVLATSASSGIWKSISKYLGKYQTYSSNNLVFISKVLCVCAPLVCTRRAYACIRRACLTSSCTRKSWLKELFQEKCGMICACTYILDSHIICYIARSSTRRYC